MTDPTFARDVSDKFAEDGLYQVSLKITSHPQTIALIVVVRDGLLYATRIEPLSDPASLAEMLRDPHVSIKLISVDGNAIPRLD